MSSILAHGTAFKIKWQIYTQVHNRYYTHISSEFCHAKADLLLSEKSPYEIGGKKNKRLASSEDGK
jgi:hypothetical protein